MAVGGSNSYPSLNDIAGLVRTFVNDDKKGATGTPGEGQILTNTSVTTARLMDSAIREVYRECQIMGLPALIKDNYLLLGLTPVNSSLGVGTPNPAVQVSLAFTGYFDGLQVNSNLTLPPDMIEPLEVWQRQNGTDYDFAPMKQAEGALRSARQDTRLGEWEWRTDQIWMNGSILSMDVRLRYICQFAALATSNINWSSTYVPILDCQEAVADKITVRYARRLGGDELQDAKDQARMSILQLRQRLAKQKQFINYVSPQYGQNRAGGAGRPSNFLF